MLLFYHKYQNEHMEPYHKSELVFPGVTIEKIEMDRLITYFDQFYGDISNAVWDTKEELKDEKFQVSVNGLITKILNLINNERLFTRYGLFKNV